MQEDFYMATKTKTVFICTECGYTSPKWAGKCAGCGAWNSMTEEIVSAEKAKPLSGRSISDIASSAPLKLREIDYTDENRIPTGIKEFDRVLGGGIVAGSLVLISGEPGIGKSTILLQMCKSIVRDISVLYISGEESPKQIKMRAERIGVTSDNILILSETDLSRIRERILEQKPDIVIIDSVQTISREDISSSPGSVSQVKECTGEFMRIAKSSGIPIFLIGHVNKEGSIAGPKVMEHMVDAVLYFEGERTLDCRILRAVKNRFGSTNEIGVFEMAKEGLREIENPSAMFMQGKPEGVSGIATVAVLEGTRPIIAEIQALVSQTPFPAPRRVSTGYDYNRLNLLIAVLEKRCGLYFGNSDAYLNIIGGLRISEPAADLAIATALASSLKDFIIPSDTVLIGEIGLAGEVRIVSSIEKRIIEARKLGFTRAIIPAKNKIGTEISGMEIIRVSSLRDVLSKL